MTADIGLFDAWFISAVSGPSVGLALLARIDLAERVARFHNGAGRLVARTGETFLGLADPGETRLVAIGAVEEPRPGVAAAVEITLTGCDVTFVRTLRADGAAFEGRTATLMIQAFDPSDGALIGEPVAIFDGQMSVPEIRRPSREQIDLRVTIESAFWSGRAVATWGMVSDADQKRRYPGEGDSIGRQVGASYSTRWPGPS